MGLDPGAAAGKLALILGMIAAVGAGSALFVAYINRQTATSDIAEQRRRQVAAREERRARIAEQKSVKEGDRMSLKKMLSRYLLVDLFKGLRVTFKQQSPSEIITEQYPKVRPR